MIGKALWIKQSEPQLYEVSARGLGGLGELAVGSSRTDA
jgi:hypothetical protein